MVLFVLWFASGWIGIAADRVQAALHVPDSISLVLFITVVSAVEFAIGFLAVVVTARMGLP